MIPELRIEDYSYDLPDSRIAKYPLERRDSSKLLIYNQGKVREDVFRNLAGHLPQGGLMVFNDTKVVPARLLFRRDTGALIEIFCLEPSDPAEYNVSFASTGRCIWKCVIGNARKWKGDVLHFHDNAAMDLRASLVGRDGQTGTVLFEWDSGIAFSEVLETCGRVPIPPYLNRETESIDIERYQTLYAKVRGSVAAPTAGLHFTGEVLSDIDARGISRERVCLHVGAGTFLPVKSSLVAEHHMHREPFVVSRDLIGRLLRREGPVTAVGTTSVRTLESLYYIGAELLRSGRLQDVDQWAPYSGLYDCSLQEALGAIISYLDANGLKEIKAGTRIIIVPGFRFRIVDALVTNFHQPQSTLLLLISAFVGGDWKTIYDYALDNGFRFLSYGDSSLLFRNSQL